MRKAQFAGLSLTGLLAGNEVSTMIALHPALRALPLRSQIEAERALTARLGRIMPFYMGSTLAAASAAAVERRGGRGFGLALLSAGSTAAMLAMTLKVQLPLNERTVEFSPDGEAEEWSAIRRRWERFHRARVALDLIAFGCLAAAALDD